MFGRKAASENHVQPYFFFLKPFIEMQKAADKRPEQPERPGNLPGLFQECFRTLIFLFSCSQQCFCSCLQEGIDEQEIPRGAEVEVEEWEQRRGVPHLHSGSESTLPNADV